MYVLQDGFIAPSLAVKIFSRGPDTCLCLLIEAPSNKLQKLKLRNKIHFRWLRHSVDKNNYVI